MKGRCVTIKRIISIILTCLMFISLFGCSSMLEREFLFTSKHIDPSDLSQDNKISEASSYNSLQNILLSTIKNCETEKTIRLTDYTGNVDTDVKKVLKEITQNPIGSYAVSNIVYQQSKILTYYELSFTVTYRRTKAQIAGISTIFSASELEDKLSQSLMQFPDQLTFDIYNYSEDAYDFTEIFNHAYYSDPSVAYGHKSVTATLYPEDGGTRRIVELSIGYTEPGINLRSKSIKTRSIVEDHAQTLINTKDINRRILNIHDLICETTQYDTITADQSEQSEVKLPRTDPFTAYGVFNNGSAVSEGYALAFKQLCDNTDINCRIIHGRLQGIPHVWNLVEVDGKWYHVDVSSDDIDDGYGYRFFAVTDEVISQTHSWDASLYPAANGTELRGYIPRENAEDSRLDTVIYHQDPTGEIDDDERTVSVEGTLPEDPPADEDNEPAEVQEEENVQPDAQNVE